MLRNPRCYLKHLCSIVGQDPPSSQDVIVQLTWKTKQYGFVNSIFNLLTAELLKKFRYILKRYFDACPACTSDVGEWRWPTSVSYAPIACSCPELLLNNFAPLSKTWAILSIALSQINRNMILCAYLFLAEDFEVLYVSAAANGHTLYRVS